MAIYLGNLSAEQIAARIGIKLTDTERETLEGIREQNTSMIKGRPVWHCYDIPFVIACGTYDTAVKVAAIFKNHEGEMKGSLEIALCE